MKRSDIKINVEVTDKSDEKEITFNIEGLSAPIVTLSKPGNAHFEYRIYSFKQTEYILKLTKQKKQKNNFRFRVGKKSIKLTAVPRKKFINVTAS